MLTVKEHLELAVNALDAERDQLLHALQLATASNYAKPYTAAIDKALVTNHEAELHISNLLFTVHHPTAPPYRLKPGIIQPRRG